MEKAAGSTKQVSSEREDAEQRERGHNPLGHVVPRVLERHVLGDEAELDVPRVEHADGDRRERGDLDGPARV